MLLWEFYLAYIHIHMALHWILQLNHVLCHFVAACICVVLCKEKKSSYALCGRMRLWCKCVCVSECALIVASPTFMSRLDLWINETCLYNILDRVSNNTLLSWLYHTLGIGSCLSFIFSFFFLSTPIFVILTLQNFALIWHRNFMHPSFACSLPSTQKK